MKKRIVSAVLCTAMVAGSLVGCGSKKAEETTAATTRQLLRQPRKKPRQLRARPKQLRLVHTTLPICRK